MRQLFRQSWRSSISWREGIPGYSEPKSGKGRRQIFAQFLLKRREPCHSDSNWFHFSDLFLPQRTGVKYLRVENTSPISEGRKFTLNSGREGTKIKHIPSLALHLLTCHSGSKCFFLQFFIFPPISKAHCSQSMLISHTSCDRESRVSWEWGKKPLGLRTVAVASNPISLPPSELFSRLECLLFWGALRPFIRPGVS